MQSQEKNHGKHWWSTQIKGFSNLANSLNRNSYTCIFDQSWYYKFGNKIPKKSEVLKSFKKNILFPGYTFNSFENYSQRRNTVGKNSICHLLYQQENLPWNK